jgi:hypothetical protein
MRVSLRVVRNFGGSPMSILLGLLGVASCLGLASCQDTASRGRQTSSRPPPERQRCTTGTAFDKPVQRVITEVWGRHARRALEIAKCESGHRGTRARNGHYRGLFQMSRQARREYGHGPCAESQARAAYRYFVRVGKRWWPWSCAKRRR